MGYVLCKYGIQTSPSPAVQKARKIFTAHLSNASQQRGQPLQTGAATLAVAYAEAEARRQGVGYLPLALHALAWLAGPPCKFVPLQEKGAQMPSEARSVLPSDAGKHGIAFLPGIFATYVERKALKQVIFLGVLADKLLPSITCQTILTIQQQR